MFFSSVFVPSSPEPAGRSEMFASQRSEPSSMFTSLTPSWRSVVRSRRSHSPACSGVREVGLGDDLRERRAAAVEVDDALVRALNPPARADVDQLGRVLLQVDSMDPYIAQPPAEAERLVVLGDLVALRQVGVEVVLAVEDRARRELRLERHPDHQAEVHGARVRHRQAPRQAEADRAGVRVGGISERQLAAAEHLRAGLQLDVDLQADHGLELAHRRACDPSKPSSRSSAWAASSSRFSLNAGPAICRPTGNPSLSPQGIEIAGIPASDIGTVQ